MDWKGIIQGQLLLLLSSFLIISCRMAVPEPGVSYELASERSGFLSGVQYSMEFDLTGERGQMYSVDTVQFLATERKDVVLDFKVPEENLLAININGRGLDAEIVNEHIIIPRRYVKKGRNVAVIEFIADEQSLNRRDGFLFTLLVPDRARTLFPCFDQPDMKAVFSLSLNVPENWVSVSNTEVCCETNLETSTKYRFAPTSPLSTYLFSFVAGRFEQIESERNGRTVTMYHRETDSDKVAQSVEIFNLVFDSLDWLEEYTGIPYPFEKYDFVVLPDFQYGGMEHAGATLYNDKRIFLSNHPTTDELLERASLIAHETAHMWFGDYVTMRWFDDVWTKEVFANWYAAQMMRPLFPSVNHSLADLKDYYASAYSEDRTRGSNAIRRPLGNLQDAGLIYCNIIYDKAPVVMDKMAEMIGWDNFREGIREYLTRFGYANATWDDLVDILDRYTGEDLKEWSRVWIKEAGMPVYSGKVVDGNLEVTMEDPLGRGLEWKQNLTDKVAEGRYWIPNVDGKGYGWFKPDEESLKHILDNWDRYGETARMSLLMTLYENSWHGTLDKKEFIRWCSKVMLSENNPLIFSSILSYAASEALRCDEECPEYTSALHSIASDRSADHESRLMAFRRLFKSKCTSGQWEELYSIWKDMHPYPGLELSESDYTDMSLQLMLAFPDDASNIAEVQEGRITNPDRKETFGVLCKAASPDYEVRRALFNSFLESSENRRPESRVLSAMALLCHWSRQDEAIGYITPALDALPEIQRTGDIFFPASWCRTLLGCQQNQKGKDIVDGWIASHPETNPLLVTKILQAY